MPLGVDVRVPHAEPKPEVMGHVPTAAFAPWKASELQISPLQCEATSAVSGAETYRLQVSGWLQATAATGLGGDTHCGRAGLGSQTFWVSAGLCPEAPKATL